MLQVEKHPIQKTHDGLGDFEWDHSRLVQEGTHDAGGHMALRETLDEEGFPRPLLESPGSPRELIGRDVVEFRTRHRDGVIGVRPRHLAVGYSQQCLGLLVLDRVCRLPVGAYEEQLRPIGGALQGGDTLVRLVGVLRRHAEISPRVAREDILDERVVGGLVAAHLCGGHGALTHGAVGKPDHHTVHHLRRRLALHRPVGPLVRVHDELHVLERARPVKGPQISIQRVHELLHQISPRAIVLHPGN